MKISYVMAGYNEESIIRDSVRKCIEMLERDFDDYELILVNDASKDKTGQIMKELADQNAKIVVLDNIVNLNFGTSILRGIKSATSGYVIYNAADLPLPLDDTKAIVEEAQKYDVLVLERIEYQAVAWRKVTSSGNRILLNMLYPKLMRGTPITNYVQVFKTDVIDSILPFARSPIFVWPEMIFRAKLAGLRVGNMKNKPHIENKRAGAFGKPHDIIWGMYEMLRFRNRLWARNI